jgi:transcription-repair coupling factor (superfamily II helicase)
MLNEKGIRELAYVAEITDVRPIEGYDRVELVVVNDGWTCVVGKGQFSKGDLAVYFEIDSKLPEREPFSNNEFIVRKKYKVQTQKMCKSISQGLIMGLNEFGFDPAQYKKGDFLTEQLGVTYAVKEDNVRKASRGDNKYARMAKHHPKLAKTWVWRELYKTNIGKKILYFVFGRTEKKRSDWPAWVQKTDEERIQNMTWILNDKEPWIVTEKIDGTSTTFTVHKKKRGKGYDFYVCSRNVVFDSDEKKCFYDENYYTAMAKKYNVKEVLTKIAEEGNYEWVTLQGETFGKGVQKREYNLDGQEFFGFNFITDKEGRWNSVDAANKLFPYGIHWVPILDKNFILPDTLEEMLAYADGESICDFGMREGVVLRSQDGTKSFKVVSNEFLLKYHS